MKSKFIRRQVFLPEELHERLKLLRKTEGISQQFFIRAAIKEALRKREPHIKGTQHKEMT